MDSVYELCRAERYDQIHDSLLHEIARAGCVFDDFRGASNRTILHCAVNNQTLNLAFIRAAIRYGASANAVDIYGNTPLMYACKRRSQAQTAELVQVLLENGADVHLKNRNKETVMTAAALNPYLPHAVIGMLLHRGGNTKELYNGKCVMDLIRQRLEKASQLRYVTMLDQYQSVVMLSATSQGTRHCACKTLPMELFREMRVMLY